MDVTNFLGSTGAIIMVVVYTVCAAVKMIPKVPDWIIPIVAICLGAIIGTLFGVLVPENDVFQTILIGVLAGGSAVGINQVVKQSINRDSGDTTETTEDTSSETESEDK